MNKQVIIAGLLGAASAQSPDAECIDQFTEYTKQELAAIENQRAGLAAATAGLEEATELEATAVETATANYNTQVGLMAPFGSALTQATEAWQAQSTAKQTAQDVITELGSEVTAGTRLYVAKQALDTAESAMTTVEEVYNEQVAAVAKLLASQTEHATEVGTLTTALQTATTAEETAIAAYEAAEAVKQAYVNERAVAETGQAAVLVTKTEEYESAEEAFTTDSNEETAAWYTAGSPDTGYKVSKAAYDKKVKEIALLAAGCSGFTVDMSGVTVSGAAGDASEAMNCETQANDPIGVIKDAADAELAALESTFESDETTWEGKVTDYATQQSLEEKAKAWKEIATTNDTAIATKATDEDSTISAALEAKETATEAKETAQTDLTTAEAQETQAQTDYARGEEILADLLAELTPLRDDYVVKTYLLAQENAELVAQTAAKAAADALLADLATLETMAEETVDRAQLAVDFYQLRLVEALESEEVASDMLNQNQNWISMADTMIEEAKKAKADAIAGCKSDGYFKAQKALRAKLDKEADDKVLIEEVKEDYDIASKMPSDGSAGTLCNYTVRTSLDEEVGDRPLCNEGLCCGAAQKFMKDGTKLAIETCQSPTTRTYQYYPPLPARAVAAPAVETWRFQCISGAQKLVAAATAALAAGYMMA